MQFASINRHDRLLSSQLMGNCLIATILNYCYFLVNSSIMFSTQILNSDLVFPSDCFNGRRLLSSQ